MRDTFPYCVNTFDNCVESVQIFENLFFFSKQLKILSQLKRLKHLHFINMAKKQKLLKGENELHSDLVVFQLASVEASVVIQVASVVILVVS